MIEIIVNCIPFGDRSIDGQEIAKIKIVNRFDHKDRPEYGNYDCMVTTKDGSEQFVIKDHCRDDGVGPLIRNIMRMTSLL